MTRKEAIKILEKCKEKGFKYTFYTVNEYHTAWDMAIKALRREDTFIDKVIEIIDGCKFSYKEDEVSAWDGIQWHNRALEQAKQAVEALRGEQDE